MKAKLEQDGHQPSLRENRLLTANARTKRGGERLLSLCVDDPFSTHYHVSTLGIVYTRYTHYKYQ